MDQLREDRSYTPPIKFDADNDGGPQFEDSLLNTHDDNEEDAESFGNKKPESFVSPVKSEDEMLDLHYDPILDC